MDMSEDQLISLFREKGYKVTPQRLAICKHILSSTIHPTAEQIHLAIKKIHPRVSLNTVYLTLNMLVDLRLIQELPYDASSHYDPNMSVHVNLICRKCKKIWDYESKAVAVKWNEIVALIGEPAIGQRLDLYTICEDCRE